MFSSARIRCFVLGLALAAAASGVQAAKPVASSWADVRITYGGQTFGFSGAQTSFSQGQDGGRIVFNVNQVDTPGVESLPQIDVSSLPATGNHWEVITKVNNRSYSFIGTCASQTFTLLDPSGALIRHLFLNCRDLTTN
jgi:hypothetical protein